VTFTVTLPLPPLGASPNSRLHYYAKARAVKAARKVAWYWFKRAKPSDWNPVPLILSVVYHCPQCTVGYKPRDVQNAIAALKPAVDGMVDAGLIPDDSRKWLSWGEVTLSRRANGQPPGVHMTIVPQPQGGPA
jgi:hypothetical protein